MLKYIFPIILAFILFTGCDSKSDYELQQEITIEQKELEVFHALEKLVAAEIAFNHDNGTFTKDFDDLRHYGWEKNPNVVYSEIETGMSIDGGHILKVSASHKDKGPRTFIYDNLNNPDGTIVPQEINEE